jgi:hypothetical protein
MGASWSLWGLFGGLSPARSARGGDSLQPASLRSPAEEEDDLLEMRLGGHEADAESVVLLTDEELEAEEWCTASASR